MDSPPPPNFEMFVDEDVMLQILGEELGEDEEGNDNEDGRNSVFSYRDDIPAVIEEKWRVQDCLGVGATGIVYRVVDVDTGEEFALKVDRLVNDPQDVIIHENEVYKKVKGGKGIANVYWCGKIGSVSERRDTYNGLVMDKLGDPLNELLRRCGGTFSVATVAKLGEEIVNIFEDLHGNSYIHRDIKPQNFMIGDPKTVDKNKVYLIDFGYSKKYRDLESLVHLEYGGDKEFVGAVPYASIHGHLKATQSRRDDLEAVGYLLVYFLKGKLPWMKKKEETVELMKDNQDNDKEDESEKVVAYRKNVLKGKAKTTIEELCEGLPKEFGDYLNYVRHLKFVDKPDYGYLKGLFSTVVGEHGNRNDGNKFKFDWDN